MIEQGISSRRVFRADIYNIQFRYMRVAAERQVFLRFIATRSTGNLAMSSLRPFESAIFRKAANNSSAWSSKYPFGIVG